MKDQKNQLRAFGLLLILGSILTLATLWNIPETDRR